MTLVGIFDHHSYVIPIVMEVSSTEKFLDLCEKYHQTDWAHLMNKETG